MVGDSAAMMPFVLSTNSELAVTAEPGALGVKRGAISRYGLRLRGRGVTTVSRFSVTIGSAIGRRGGRGDSGAEATSSSDSLGVSVMDSGW